MTWQKILRTNFTDWKALATFLELNEAQRREVISSSFPLNLPYRLAEKISKGTLIDPLLRQFLPTRQELFSPPGFSTNPVGDTEARCSPRLLHKYEGRALLVATSACAMHCRYCFRRHFDYADGPIDYTSELKTLADDPSITEIILSGGDPLSLSNRHLKNLLDHLSAIPHLRRIRFHSRFPIGIPERIDDELLALLDALPQQVWFVTHINHPRELDSDILSALSKLRRLGIPLLNQAVLLRGINDTVETLHDLCLTLVDNGITPYYLHQLDKVEGGAHFEVTMEKGVALVEQLRKHLPGYAVPTYVRESAGEPSKSPLVEFSPPESEGHQPRGRQSNEKSREHLAGISTPR